MQRSALRLAGISSLLALTLFLGQPRSAAACGDFACWLIFSDGSSLHGRCTIIAQAQAKSPGSTIMRMGETTITPLGPHRALITVTGYVATSMDTSCATGLDLVQGIQAINSSSVVHAETGEPLAELHFAPNRLAGPGFAAAASQEDLTSDLDWQGFFSKVSRPVPDDTHLTYTLDVTLKPGVRLVDLAEQLRAEGVLGTARANADGSLNSAHIHLRTLGETPVLIELPPRPSQHNRPARSE